MVSVITAVPPGFAPPVTKPPPMEGNTEAMATLLLLHPPPGVGSLNVVLAPLHIVEIPEMASGCVFTNTEAAELQVTMLSVILVEPTLPPVTVPAGSTEATNELPLLHTP